MAVGDIVRLGALYVDGVEFGTSGYSTTSYSSTMVEYRDVTTDSRKRNFIEISINGEKAYLDSHYAFQNANNKCMYYNNNRKCTIEGREYRMALLSESEWKNLPKNVLEQIDWEMDTLTSSFENNNGVWLRYFTSESRWLKVLWGNETEGGPNSANGAIYALIPVNNPPTISGEDKDLGNKTSSFSVTYSVLDEDSGQELTVKEKLNGSIIRTLQNPIQGSTLTFTITEELFASLSMNTTNTIEIEVTDGSATTYRRYTFIKTNSAPLINYSGQSDLGQLTSKPTITYSVSDNEGDTITVTEKLNGEVIRQFTATSNTNYTITLTDEFWLTCGKNTNTIEISASDVNGGTSYKYITFTRQVNKVQITTKNPIETDAAATKIMVSPDWDKTGCTGKVEVCNNGFDASPTWEDMTTMAALNRPYVFTNKTKTAAKWGIKIRLTLTKNEGYTGEVAIYGFGGAYE